MEEGKKMFLVSKKDHAVLAQELREHIVDSFVNGDGAKDAYIQSLVTQYVHHDIWSERMKEGFTLVGDAVGNILDKSLEIVLQAYEADNTARVQAAFRNFQNILSPQAIEPKSNVEAKSCRSEVPQPPASSAAIPAPNPVAEIPEPVAATPMAGISNITTMSMDQWLIQNPGADISIRVKDNTV
jgi:hypothetical protein